jgi:hypothetical protein
MFVATGMEPETMDVSFSLMYVGDVQAIRRNGLESVQK